MRSVQVGAIVCFLARRYFVPLRIEEKPPVVRRRHIFGRMMDGLRFFTASVRLHSGRCMLALWNWRQQFCFADGAAGLCVLGGRRSGSAC